MKRRKIVTLPSPTRQGSQTWCTASIPGIYCGVEVRAISVVFYTCRSCWFRSATAAFVRFTKAGDGKWKWGQSPCRRSHKHVSQIPRNVNEASQSPHWCPVWPQTDFRIGLVALKNTQNRLHLNFPTTFRDRPNFWENFGLYINFCRQHTLFFLLIYWLIFWLCFKCLHCTFRNWSMTFCLCTTHAAASPFKPFL